MKKRISWKIKPQKFIIRKQNIRKVSEYNWHIKNENTKKIQELKKSII